MQKVFAEKRYFCPILPQKLIPITMKKILLLIIVSISLYGISFSQNRNITRGAEPRELYICCEWYGIYNPVVYYDTLQAAIFRLTENGKK